MESVSGISWLECCGVPLGIWRILRGMFHVKHGVSTTNQLFHVKRRMGGWVMGGWFLRTVFIPLLSRSRCFTWNMVGWLSYGVGNLKSTTSPPHAIEGSVFHVKRGCVTCWGWGGVFMGSWAVSFFLVLWWCGGFTWNMGNACKGNLLWLQSCFLVLESFSMFHVKHDVSTTTQLFYVKRWLFLL